ncbi:hypothetical protein B0H14DRAFT_3431420 [Mycena olivaceomarginata]|nr:hypothetical protein B0H14DRAFT_3431420 [Mycena olivaceomarginata]
MDLVWFPTLPPASPRYVGLSSSRRPRYRQPMLKTFKFLVGFAVDQKATASTSWSERETVTCSFTDQFASSPSNSQSQRVFGNAPIQSSPQIRSLHAQRPSINDLPSTHSESDVTGIKRPPPPPPISHLLRDSPVDFSPSDVNGLPSTHSDSDLTSIKRPPPPRPISHIVDSPEDFYFPEPLSESDGDSESSLQPSELSLPPSLPPRHPSPHHQRSSSSQTSSESDLTAPGSHHLGLLRDTTSSSPPLQL